MSDESKPADEPTQEPRCDSDQLAMLRRCSKKKDIAEWNQWRGENPDEEIWLEGADLRDAHLEEAILWEAHLEGADLQNAHLEGADLLFAYLKGADLQGAHMEGAKLLEAHLEGANLIFAHLEGATLFAADLRSANFAMAVVDETTRIMAREIDRKTNFTSVGLDNAQVEPGLKRSLKDNIRRFGWEEWYQTGPRKRRFLKNLFVRPFWWCSDYGRSTLRLLIVFFGLAVYFALAYWLCPGCVEGLKGTLDLSGYWHALYFSVVTMTTLGFGDIHANPESAYGQCLLMLQVILGYVLLGALVTRFAVLFSGEGPAKPYAKTWKKKRGGQD